MAYEIICDTCGRSLDESYFFKDENGNHDHTCWECLRNENRELKAKLEEIRSKVLKFADEYRHLKSSYDDIVSQYNHLLSSDSKLKRSYYAYRDENKSLREEVEDLRTRFNAVYHENIDIKQKYEVLSLENQVLRNDNPEVKSLKTEIDALIQENNKLKEDISAKDKNIGDLTYDLEHAGTTLLEKDNDIHELNNNLIH